ncbi:MAG TPA: hypothetical protein VG502_13130 [Flexivirga sp.]|uniref:hypothetical protein n=1 Tax=Flexivirga sp. TaxID=1962927 RepID=UPI002BBE8563|nr:hypothetical protein [Flexivirga sp.]HWC23235.1 hypothetical protein [Flexivirga sp.]
MLKLLLLLHLLTAIFAIGPLVHAVTTASRGLRQADAAAIASSARMAKIYSMVSVLVVIFGFGLMSQKRRGKELGSFGDTWIWLSVLLWVVAVALTFVAIVPALEKAAEQLRSAGGSSSDPSGLSSPEERSGGGRIETAPINLKAQTARVAASGGVVGIIFAVIVGLMVYRPGS